MKNSHTFNFMSGSAGEAPCALPDLVWHDDYSLTVGGEHFRLSHDTGTLLTGDSNREHFLLGKPRHMVEFAAEIGRAGRIDKLFEMGILHGGSIVLYDQLYAPSRLVAIDHAPEAVQALTHYISRRNRTHAVRPYYGIDQSDRARMRALLEGEFPGRDIDLIIDDASHYYRETREAFNICFPFLKAGGLYIIEDWAWAHWAGDFWQGPDSPFKDKTALSNLLIELFMLSASRPDFIESLFVDHNMIVVTKGAGTLPPGDFDLAAHCLLRGKTFVPFL